MADTPATAAGQRQPDRFLIAIVVGLIVLLLAAGLGVVLLRQPVPDLPADTPGGTVQRFYSALDQKDYAGAYSYLSDSMSRKPTRAEFTSYSANARSYSSQQRVRLGAAQVTGSDATLPVVITSFYNGGLFGGPFGGSSEYTSTEIFTLRREGTTWRITATPPGYLPFPGP